MIEIFEAIQFELAYLSAKFTDWLVRDRYEDFKRWGFAEEDALRHSKAYHEVGHKTDTGVAARVLASIYEAQESSGNAESSKN